MTVEQKACYTLTVSLCISNIIMFLAFLIFLLIVLSVTIIYFQELFTWITEVFAFS